MIYPTGRNLLVKREIVRESKGGIIMPDVAMKSAEEKILAKVIAVGPKCEDDIAEGDLLYTTGNAYACEDEHGEKYYFVHETSVLGYRR